MSVVYTKLEAFSREDLIKRFVSAEFNRFLDYYKNAPDLNVPEGRERRDRDRDRTSSGKDFALFRINLGSMDGLNARDLISLINEFTRNRSIVIGKASINKKFSLFEADGKYTDTMLNAFRSGNFEGRRISVELAREGDTIERKERSYRGERGGERGGDRGFGRPQRREYKRNK